MEVSEAAIFILVAVTMVTVGWRILNWVWVRPKYLERRLREQGFAGNPYRIFFGDLKESSMMSKQANSKPINFSDDISPRVVPISITLWRSMVRILLCGWPKTESDYYGPGTNKRYFDQDG
ncbi:hypothetical protein SLA2020_282250 [Shorea laevis]